MGQSTLMRNAERLMDALRATEPDSTDFQRRARNACGATKDALMGVGDDRYAALIVAGMTNHDVEDILRVVEERS